MLLISKSKYTPYRPKLLSLMWLFLNFYSMAEQSFIKKQVSQSSSVPRLQKNLKQNKTKHKYARRSKTKIASWGTYNTLTIHYSKIIF